MPNLDELYGTLPEEETATDYAAEPLVEGEEYAGLGEIIEHLIKLLGRKPTEREVSAFITAKKGIGNGPILSRIRQAEQPVYTLDDVAPYVKPIDPAVAKAEALAKRQAEVAEEERTAKAYSDTAYVKPYVRAKKAFGAPRGD